MTIGYVIPFAGIFTAFAVSYIVKRIHRHRFTRHREDLTDEQLHALATVNQTAADPIAANIAREPFARAWHKAANVLDLPPGKLRPSDALSDLHMGIVGLMSDVDALRMVAGDPRRQLVTFGDAVVAIAGRSERQTGQAAAPAPLSWSIGWSVAFNHRIMYRISAGLPLVQIANASRIGVRYEWHQLHKTRYTPMIATAVLFLAVFGASAWMDERWLVIAMMGYTSVMLTVYASDGARWNQGVRDLLEARRVDHFRPFANSIRSSLDSAMHVTTELVGTMIIREGTIVMAATGILLLLLGPADVAGPVCLSAGFLYAISVYVMLVALNTRLCSRIMNESKPGRCAWCQYPFGTSRRCSECGFNVACQMSVASKIAQAYVQAYALTKPQADPQANVQGNKQGKIRSCDP